MSNRLPPPDGHEPQRPVEKNPAAGDPINDNLVLTTVYISQGEPPLADPQVVTAKADFLPDTGVTGSSFLFLAPPGRATAARRAIRAAETARSASPTAR